MAAHVAGSFREAAKSPKRKTAKKDRSQSGHMTRIWSLMDELRQKFRLLEGATLRFMLSHYSLEENVVMISSLLRFPPEEAAVESEVKKVKGNGASGTYELGEKTYLLVAKKHVGTKLAARKRRSTKDPMKKRKEEKKPGKLSSLEPGRQVA